MKKRFLILSIIIMFITPIVIYGAGRVTVKKTQNRTYKRVILDHAKHKAAGVKRCKSCHHKGPVSKSCAAVGCHKGKAGTKKLHDSCIGCHKTKGGPKKCKACHKH